MSREQLIKEITQESGLEFVEFLKPNGKKFVVSYKGSRIHLATFEEKFGVYIYSNQKAAKCEEVFSIINEVAKKYYHELCYEYSKIEIQKLYERIDR